MFRKHNPQEKFFNSATNFCDRKKAKLFKTWAEPFKHFFDLTDESTVENFTFSTLWHHALDLAGYDCNLCRKTLYNFHSKLFKSQKHLALFYDVRNTIIEQANLKFSTQRLDTVWRVGI